MIATITPIHNGALIEFDQRLSHAQLMDLVRAVGQSLTTNGAGISDIGDDSFSRIEVIIDINPRRFFRKTLRSIARNMRGMVDRAVSVDMSVIPQRHHERIVEDDE